MKGSTSLTDKTTSPTGPTNKKKEGPVGNCINLLIYSGYLFKSSILFAGIVAAFSTIWLVESKGHPAPQTMEDLEIMKRETKNLFNFRG